MGHTVQVFGIEDGAVLRVLAAIRESFSPVLAIVAADVALVILVFNFPGFQHTQLEQELSRHTISLDPVHVAVNCAIMDVCSSVKTCNCIPASRLLLLAEPGLEGGLGHAEFNLGAFEVVDAELHGVDVGGHGSCFDCI